MSERCKYFVNYSWAINVCAARGIKHGDKCTFSNLQQAECPIALDRSGELGRHDVDFDIIDFNRKITEAHELNNQRKR